MFTYRDNRYWLMMMMMMMVVVVVVMVTRIMITRMEKNYKSFMLKCSVYDKHWELLRQKGTIIRD